MGYATIERVVVVEKKFEKTFENPLTNQKAYDTIYSQKGKENPKHQKGNESMATNIEKKITKSLVFGAGVEWLNSLDPETVMGVRSISVGGEEQSVEITAGMLAEKLAHEIEQLGKKNSPDKPSPIQEANKQMSEELYENMEVGKPYTVTDLTKTVSPAIGLNISKVRPWLTRLMEDGRVERTVVKGKPVFTKVG